MRGLSMQTQPAGAPQRPPLPWKALLLAAVACGLAVGLLVLLFGVLHLGYGFNDVSDVGYYHFQAGRLAAGGRPYVDVLLEYPPLMLPLLRLPPFTPKADLWTPRFQALMFLLCGAAALLTTACAARLWPGGRRAHRTALAYAGAVLAAGAIVANRLDASVALSVAATLWLLSCRRFALAAAAVGIGVGLKLVPAVLLPLVLLVAPQARQRWRALGAFAVAALLPFLPYLAAPGLLRVFRYHLERPLQIESVLASPLHLARLLGLASASTGRSHGSEFLDAPGAGTLAQLSGPLAALAVGAVYLLLWRRRSALRADPTLVPVAALGVLLAVLACGKVLSPQYLVWLLPCVALVLARSPWLGGCALGLLLLTQVGFPGLYWGLVAFEPLPVVLLLLRNLLLLVTLGLVLRHLARYGVRLLNT